MTERWDADAIEYTDVDAIKTALVGRQIVGREGDGGDYPEKIRYLLDDGTALVASAADGGCACSNGCFDVQHQNDVSGTILNVEVREVTDQWENQPRPVQLGSISDGSGKISVFVYTELGEHLLLTPEGGDNGYYGWGFWLNVERPEVTSE